MSGKRPQAAYEADGSGVSDSNPAPLVTLGAAFPALDSKTRIDGSHVPFWKQGVTDERGRQRLRGSFTEGLSAGYFNTVESEEGWTPATFKSSRGAQAKAAQAQPEVFMDGGGLKEATEIQIAERASGFSRIGSTEKELGPGVSQVTLMDLPAPAVQDTMCAELLKRMGWKEDQAIGPNIQSKAVIDNAVGDIEKTYLFAPADGAVVRFTQKNNSKGLGYVGEDRLPRGKESRIDCPGVKEKKRKGDEFGVGALNDNGEGDEDLYEIRSKNAYNRVIGSVKKDLIVKPVKHGSVPKKRKSRSAQHRHAILSHGSTPAVPVPPTTTTPPNPSLSTSVRSRSMETSSSRTRLLRPLLPPPPPKVYSF